MRSADDLLRDILRTAHVTGLSREHQEAISAALARLVCEACERASVRGMSDLAPLPLASSLVTEARDRLLVLHARPPEDPRAVMAEIEACAALLSRAIGGPIDPNAPAGS